MTRQQFISCLEATQGAFRRFLLALCCGDAALADDIAQEAYIKAYLSCDTLDDEGKFAAWLRRIGYNSFLNNARSQRIYSDPDQAAEVAAPDRADAAYDYEDLYAALASMPSNERTATLLFYMEGYSTQEIAKIIGTSQNAVKQSLSRGRNRLCHLLTK